MEKPNTYILRNNAENIPLTAETDIVRNLIGR